MPATTKICTDFLEDTKCVRKSDPVLGSKKRAPKSGPFLGLDFNSYCNGKVGPILESVFWIPKWGPRFGQILNFQGNHECLLRSAKDV